MGSRLLVFLAVLLLGSSGRAQPYLGEQRATTPLGEGAATRLACVCSTL